MKIPYCMFHSWSGVTDQGSLIRARLKTALVELVDIFPSVSELAGFQFALWTTISSWHASKIVVAIVSLLENPNKQWKKTTFSQHPCPNVGLHAQFPRGRCFWVVLWSLSWGTQWELTHITSQSGSYGFDHETDTHIFDDVRGTELYNLWASMTRTSIWQLSLRWRVWRKN